MAGGSGFVNQAAGASQGAGGMPQPGGVLGNTMQQYNTPPMQQPAQQPTGLFGGNFPQPNTTPGQQAPAVGFGNLAGASLAMPYDQPQQPQYQPAQMPPAFEQLKNPEFQAYRTQAQDLQRQMDEYIRKAPMYQQLQDLQSKMRGFGQPSPMQTSPMQPSLHQQNPMEQMARQKAMEQMLGQQPMKPAGGLDALAQAQSQLMAPQQPAAPSPSASMQQPQPARSPFGGFRRRRM
jgi:hypothetical protein